MKYIALLLVSYLPTQWLRAQPMELTEIHVPVYYQGQLLHYPFAGGLNAPIFSQADLNRDGIRDIVAFERIGNEVRTFLGTSVGGDTGLVYAPRYADAFPNVEYWMLLRDFDQDGISDLFTTAKDNNSPNNIKVFKGYYQGDTLRFSPILFQYPNCSNCPTPYLPYTDSGNNWYALYNSPLGIPAIEDVDGDGDTDILAFDPEGEHLYWFKNKAKELALPTDSLLFELASSCWGRFADPALSQCAKILSEFQDSCAQGFLAKQTLLHPGSSVTALDIEGDGDHDLLLGSIGSNCLTMLENGGNAQQAWITHQDSLFPHYNQPVDLFIFPAAYSIDVDLDDQLDLLVASCSASTLQDWGNVWYYQQQNHLYLRQNEDFMVGEMLDFGTGAHPVFTDQNGDGLWDLVVGNLGQMVNNYPKHAKLRLFLNKGTPQQPIFELADEDWLGFTAFLPNDFDFRPAFGDLDQDGDDDIVVGNAFGQLYFIENQTNATTGVPQYATPVANWWGIDVGVSSAPFIYDLDQDGLMDLLVGERAGNINFFKNMGSPTQAQFEAQPTIQQLGGIQVGLGIGHTSPVILTTVDSAQWLFSGSWQGRLFTYPNIVPTQDTLVPLEHWDPILGQHASPTFADLDNDGYYEMAAGIQSGGIKLYKTELKTPNNAASAQFSLPNNPVRIMPNPAQGYFLIDSDAPMTYTVVDTVGKTWVKGKKNAGHLRVETTNWPAGIYFIKLMPTNGIEVSYTLIISTK